MNDEKLLIEPQPPYGARIGYPLAEGGTCFVWEDAKGLTKSKNCLFPDELRQPHYRVTPSEIEGHWYWTWIDTTKIKRVIT